MAAYPSTSCDACRPGAPCRECRAIDRRYAAKIEKRDSARPEHVPAEAAGLTRVYRETKRPVFEDAARPAPPPMSAPTALAESTTGERGAGGTSTDTEPPETGEGEPAGCQACAEMARSLQASQDHLTIADEIKLVAERLDDTHTEREDEAANA